MAGASQAQAPPTDAHTLSLILLPFRVALLLGPRPMSRCTAGRKKTAGLLLPVVPPPPLLLLLLLLLQQGLKVCHGTLSTLLVPPLLLLREMPLVVLL